MPEETNQSNPIPSPPPPAEQPVQGNEQASEEGIPPAHPLEEVVSIAPVPLLLAPVIPKPPLTCGQRMSAFLRWFRGPDNIAVCAMAVVVLILHVMLITTPVQVVSTPEWIRQFQLHESDKTNPDPPAQFIFDEAHYIPEAIRFLHRELPDSSHGLVRSEHPPLGKWLIASGIFFFGDNPVGWRLPSIIFGVASIFIFYFICRRLAGQERDFGAGSLSLPERGFWKFFQVSTFVPVLATFVFAFENMSFIQAQVAMLDPFYLTFMLLGVLFYLRKNWAVAGVFMGLSMLCKAMAVLPVFGLFLHWAVTRRCEIWYEFKYTWNALRGRKEGRPEKSEVLGIVKFLVAIPIVWFGLLVLLEYPVVHQWANPITRTTAMLSSHLSLKVGDTLATGISTRPWTWLYYPGGLYYWYTPHFFGSIGWTLWALIMPSMAYLIYDFVRGRLRRRPVADFGVFWFIGAYGLLVPLELLTDRNMYHFYFYPAVPAVSLAIAWCAWKIWTVARNGATTKGVFLGALAFVLLAVIAAFVIQSPWGTNLITLPGLKVQ